MPQRQNYYEMSSDIGAHLVLNVESMKTFFIDVCGGDINVIGELLQMYLTSLDELTRQISVSVAASDLVVLRRASHTLKSSTRVFGGEALAHNCELLEQAALSGDLSQAPALLRRVESQRESMHKQLPAAIEFAISAL